jgi:hypothetical protein
MIDTAALISFVPVGLLLAKPAAALSSIGSR